MKSFAVLLAALMPLLQAPAISNDQPYTYKTYMLGKSTFSDYRATLSPKYGKYVDHGSQCGTPVKGIRHCDEEGSDEASLVFVDDKLATVTLFFRSNGDNINGYLNALTEKFGKPTVESTSAVNGYGASIDSHAWTWKNDMGSIHLDEVAGGTISSPRASLMYVDTRLLHTMSERTATKPNI